MYGPDGPAAGLCRHHLQGGRQAAQGRLVPSVVYPDPDLKH